MARWARENGWDAPAEADAKELADAANAGDPVALRAFRRGATAVAAMIASVGAVCDLDLVVIGGGVAKSGALLFDPLREALASYAGLDFLRGLRVVPAELGGDAGLVGAAGADSAHYAASSRCHHLRRVGHTRLAGRRRAPFWLIGGRHATLDPFHRRPSVTEKSVEGPGLPGRPTQEDEAAVYQRAPTVCVGAFVISWPF